MAKVILIAIEGVAVEGVQYKNGESIIIEADLAGRYMSNDKFNSKLVYRSDYRPEPDPEPEPEEKPEPVQKMVSSRPVTRTAKQAKKDES